MSSLAPAVDAQFKWVITDSWTIAIRSFQQWIRQPAAILIGLAFPIMMVLMNTYIYGGSISVFGGGDYKDYLMPGMFALTMMFGVESTAIAMNTDSSKGVTDRFRSMPIAPSAVVMGRAVADMIYSAAQLVLMVGSGLAVGWRWNDGLANFLVACALLMLLRFSMIWLGIFLGLALKSPEAVSGVSILIWPIGFLSGVLVSPQNMPRVLEAIANWNPVSSTALAVRKFSGNPAVAEGSWVTEQAVLMAVAWPVLITALFLPLSARMYDAWENNRI